ncbi:MAG TPA: heme NO-binding domain-containing protein [Vicinamibacteria bacterium]
MRAPFAITSPVHGLLFTQLRKFVVARQGAEAWPALLQRAGLAGRIFLPVRPYPDSEMSGLLVQAASGMGLRLSDLLEALGDHMAPELIELSRTLLRPEWRTLEVIEEAERTIHRIVQITDPKAARVHLRAERRGPDELVLRYSSPRRLCALARGIMAGLARHFGERVALTETSCMQHGGPECVFSVRRGG